MRRNFYRVFFLLVLTLLWGSVLTVSGETQGKKIPPGFKGLVPQGAKITYQIFANNEVAAEVNFSAEKDTANNRVIYYKFTLRCIVMENKDLWKTMEQAYQTQLDQDSENAFQDFTEAQSSDVTDYDPPKLTKYPWGKGITQRMVHHDLGMGSGPDIIDYRCVYFGRINNILFELSVNGLPDPAEADQWAKKTAEKAAKTTISNIGD